MPGALPILFTIDRNCIFVLKLIVKPFAALSSGAELAQVLDYSFICGLFIPFSWFGEDIVTVISTIS